MKTKNYILVILLFLASCQSKYSGSDQLMVADELSEAPAMPEAMEAPERKMVSEDESGKPVIGKVKQPDKIIKEAQIKYEVEDYVISKKRVDSLVNKWGGYISKEEESRSGYQITNTIIIRVLSNNFEKLISDIGSLKGKLDYKSVNAIDVSEEYIDIMARLKTKREVEKRYYEILKKANTIEDILKVENEIRKIREEIEAKEGRLKYLNDRIAYSTITLTLYQQFEYKYEPQPERKFFTRIFKAFDKGWKGLLSFLVGIVYLWPLILILVVAYILIKRYGKKRGAKVKKEKR